MGSKKRSKESNFSNKLAYTLIVLALVVGLGVGVTAYRPDDTGTPSIFGHSIGELAPPVSGCSSGQVLTRSGTTWICSTASATDTRFSITSSGLCYTAPATCAPLTTESCNVYNSFSEDYGSSCDYVDASTLNNFCFGFCFDYGSACEGGNTPCTGGGSVGWSSASGVCGVGGVVQCTCYASGTYQLEHYTPAGTRCI
jgi:hypothetical protein